MPLASTRICPSFALVATAIVVPDAATLGVCTGLGDAWDVVSPLPQPTANRVATIAPASRSFDCMHPDTRPGYTDFYSEVTYAALMPPSTRNVEPFT